MALVGVELDTATTNDQSREASISAVKSTKMHFLFETRCC